jgi:hypothetical protein
MKTLKLITDININDLENVVKEFEELAKAEVVDVTENMHFNAIRKSFEIYTLITYKQLTDAEMS